MIKRGFAIASALYKLDKPLNEQKFEQKAEFQRLHKIDYNQSFRLLNADVYNL